MAWNIDLNNASVEVLSNIPLIGRQRAEAIVRYREEHGLFKSWDDVKNIPGFSSAVVDDLKNQGFTLGKKAA
ncbi:ComE operon protein 1 [uncultured bacterium]|jgi:competence protein ComEA|nr:ComE operon protein 1 [uncultured bacterium]